jgi:hypothetical protein
LLRHRFAVPYNNGRIPTVNAFNPQDLHARFPFNGGMVTTAVGQGFTCVAAERPQG